MVNLNCHCLEDSIGKCLLYCAQHLVEGFIVLNIDRIIPSNNDFSLTNSKTSSWDTKYIFQYEFVLYRFFKDSGCH